MEPLDQQNTLLDGAYQLMNVLGRGGMATVYEARAIETGNIVAVKVMLVKPTDLPADIQPHFFNELLLATRVRHPRIVEVIDFGVSSTGAPYIVMERLYGHTLFQELRERGPMEPARAVARLLEVLDGLEVAHGMGIVHADLKPTNLFLKHPRTEQESSTILDFGVARQLGRTRSGIGGTPRYTPPEWLRGAPIQIQGDLYQLGMVLAEMLSGETLLQATTVRQCLAVHASGPIRLPPVVSDSSFSDVVKIAMDPDPNARFRDVSELREALNRALASHQTARAALAASGFQNPKPPEAVKTVRFDDLTDFEEAVLAAEASPSVNVLSERSPSRRDLSIPPKKATPTPSPSRRLTPVPSSRRETPSISPTRTDSVNYAGSRSSYNKSGSYNQSSSYNHNSSYNKNSSYNRADTLARIEAQSQAQPTRRTVPPAPTTKPPPPPPEPSRWLLVRLLDRIPNEDRPTFISVTLLIGISLTVGAFLGTMVLILIVFAR